MRPVMSAAPSVRQRLAHVPGSRVTDPATSRHAAGRVRDDGTQASHAEIVLRAVRAHPGSTAAELGEITGLGHVRAQRRLSDLAKPYVGLVAKGDARECTVNRTGQHTWWPVLPPAPKKEQPSDEGAEQVALL